MGEASRATPVATASASAAVLARLVRLAVTVTGTDRGALFVRAGDRVGGASAVATVGEAGGMLALAGVVVRSGRASVVGGGRPVAAVPVRRGGEVAGALVIVADDPREDLKAADVELLDDLGGLCGLALDNLGENGALDTAEARARALQTAAAVWDGQATTRGDHVAQLALAIGRELGIPAAELAELEAAGRLHDVGKLRVPNEVLRRAGPLTETEWAMVRMHPVWGEELVSRVPGLEAVAGLVRLHHERIDGRGYPDALPGERIPLAARILGVCDAYTALRSDRPYRPALSVEEALAELRASTGAFDADVVTALEKQLERSPSLG
jgi:hypothetical protein